MILGFVVLVAASLSAQTFRGTILGTVTDSTGAVISGAKVEVKNTGTGQERSATTSGDGSYSVPELPIGTYTVTISQQGFQTSVTTGVVVDVAAERRVDAQMKTGEVSQRVEVSGELLPQVETTSAELGGTLTTETITNLPVNGRDYTKLIYLNPGVSGSPDQISDSPGSFGTFSMNGSRGRANNFLLDGTDMNDGYRNDPAINEAGVFGDPATILPIDAVAELRVLSNYEAEYGRNSGAVVNIVTKSGTNTWHGSALEYWRGGELGARNFFNFAPDPKAAFHNHQFGGSLGGALVKDRTFFYVNYEGQRESGGLAGLNNVPGPAELSAAQADLAARGETGLISQTMINLLARNPWHAPSSGSGLGIGTITQFNNRVDSMIGKIDHNFNANNLLTGRYYFGDSDQSFPLALQAGGITPGFNSVTPTRVQLVSLSYVKVLSTARVNEARLGWNRFVEGFFPEDRHFDPSSIGMLTGASPSDFGLPFISVTGFAPIGAAKSLPRSRVDSNLHFIDNFSWKKGAHDIKVGYEFRRTTIQLIQDVNFRGKMGFGSIADPIDPSASGPGPISPLEAFLLGMPNSGGQTSGFSRRHSYENNHGLYIQDSWRISPQLTFNAGLRWDYFGVVGEKDHLFNRFIPSTGTLVPIGKAGGPSTLYNPDHNNFAPRLSVAYDLTGRGRTVVRAGWGIFYDAFSQDIFLGHIPYNCAFCPGPAFAGATFAPNAPINTAKLSGLQITPANPVYGAPGDLGDFFGVDPHLRTPYTQNFNLNVQQQLTSRAVLQVGYVGAIGTKLFRFRDVNQPGQSAITAFDLSCTSPINNNPANCPIGGFDSGGNVPRPFGNFFYINQQESTANSNYHSLQTSLRMTSWHGLTSMVNFVWSHSIDNASDLEDFIPNAAQPNNSLATNLERGNSNFDIRRRFTWNFAYEFPQFSANHKRLTAGWGVDGVVSLQDGQPFQLNYNFEGDYSGSGEGFDRPDVVGPIHYESQPFNFLDLTAFQTPCTFGNPTASSTSGDSNCLAGTRHFGNLGRSALRGPAFKEFNFSVSKTTPITERVQLQIRAEFFNLFNHPNFANPELPNFIADPANNGLDSNGRGTGFLPLTATGDVGIGNPFLGGGGPRGIQFAGKITF
jgi:hypothetical protein